MEIGVPGARWETRRERHGTEQRHPAARAPAGWIALMPAQLGRHQLGVLILALMATGIGQSLVFAILAPLGREVRLGELQITSIIAISALVFGGASPRWGRLSDRLGRKPVIITGLLGYTLGTLLFTSVFSLGLQGLFGGAALYTLLLAARCCQSLVMSATAPASAACAADHTPPEQRVRTMARLGTANSMGTIVGPAVGGALATFGLLAPLYFAAALAAMAALLVAWQLPRTPPADLTRRPVGAPLRFRDPRIMPYLAAAVGLFVGFSGIQQTLGFRLQDRLALDGIETAQMTGAALMVCAAVTFTIQITVMQRFSLRPLQFIRIGLAAALLGAVIISGFESFAVLASGMGLLGAGMGLCMPAVAAGVSLGVTPAEQGGAAGLVSACPAIGFVAGPLCAGGLYQIDGALAPLFSAAVFLAVLVAALPGTSRG
jgi:MFS family permease